MGAVLLALGGGAFLVSQGGTLATVTGSLLLTGVAISYVGAQAAIKVLTHLLTRHTGSSEDDVAAEIKTYIREQGRKR